LARKAGEEVGEQIYHFQDKGGRDLALRPELTASVSRLYNNNLQKSAKPLKMYYFGSCFRYERPQAGRYRQFWQFGVEVIGGTSIYNEAEIIAMANEALSKVGIQDYEFAIGHLGIIKGVLNHLDISSDEITKIIASIDKEDYNLLDELLNKNQVSQEYKDIITEIINVNGSLNALEPLKESLKDIPESYDAVCQLYETLEVLEAFGFEDYEVKLSIARGLDYYTGIVFEVYVPTLGAEKQVTGGGTYNLNSLFDSEEVESTGFAFGFDRIMEAYHRQNIKTPCNDSKKVLVIPIKNDFKLDAIKVAQKLRENDIITDIDLKGKKLKKNLSFANNNNINNVIIIGKNEVETDTVTLKDMINGQQETLSLSDAINRLS
jgi:histidyl-tRNA synthetase